MNQTQQGKEVSAIGGTSDERGIEYTLRDGTRVLGKLYNGEPRPKTYVNRTQADSAAQACNGVVIQRGRPFYVRLASA